MNDSELLESLKSSLSSGKTKEEIYKDLLSKGVTIDQIQVHLNSISSQHSKEDTQKKTIRIVLTIGIVLIGAGIFSFIASNWQLMPKTMKVLVIIFFMLLSYISGFFIKEKYNLQKTGEALIILGAVIYGSGIFLIGQIFNIRANWPDGFILWMLGVLILALAVESYPLFSLAIILGIITIIGEPIVIFSSLGFLLTPSFLLLAATIITFIIGILVRRKMPEELKKFY